MRMSVPMFSAAHSLFACYFMPATCTPQSCKYIRMFNVNLVTMKRCVLMLLLSLYSIVGIHGQAQDTLRMGRVYGAQDGVLRRFGVPLDNSAVPADTIDFGTVYENDVWSPPFFPGGEEGMQEFVRKNINMPKEAWSDSTWDRSFTVVEIVVTKGGRACYIRPVLKMPPSMASEVERVVNIMPLWRPATRGGENVNCRLRVNLVVYNTSTGQPYEVGRLKSWLRKRLERGDVMCKADLDTIISRIENVRFYTRFDRVLNAYLARALFMRGDTAKAIKIMEDCSGMGEVKALYEWITSKRKHRLTDTGNFFDDTFNMFQTLVESNPYSGDFNRKVADRMLYSRIMTALLHAGSGDRQGFVSSCDSLMSALQYVSSRGMIRGDDLTGDPYYRRERERKFGDMLEGEAHNAARRRVSVAKDIDTGGTAANIGSAISKGVVDDAGTVQSNNSFHNLKGEFEQRYSVRASRRYKKLVGGVLDLLNRPVDEVVRELRPVLWLAPLSGGNADAVGSASAKKEFKRQCRHSYLLKELKRIERKIDSSWLNGDAVR